MNRLNERRTIVSDKIVNEIFRLVYTTLWMPSYSTRSGLSLFDSMRCTTDNMIRLVRSEEWMRGGKESLDAAHDCIASLAGDIDRLYSSQFITRAMYDDALAIIAGIDKMLAQSDGYLAVLGGEVTG